MTVASDRATFCAMRIALYGGSFDPPHVGHQMVCLYALATQRVDQVWVLPCYEHPFGKESASYEHRLRMCELALEPLAPHVILCTIEAELPKPSYTLRTVQALRERHPTHEFVLIIGEDLAPTLPTWYGWEQLQKSIEIVIVGREGAHHLTPPPPIRLPDVSATHIRESLQQGHLPVGLVPASVLDYMEAQGLYHKQASSPG